MTQFLNAFTALVRGNTGNFNKKYGTTKKRQRRNRRALRKSRKNRRQ